METWQEVTIRVNREAEEVVSNLLIELGSQGVAIADSADYVGQEDRYGAIFPEVEQNYTVDITAYYPDTLDLAEVTSALKERLA